MRIVPFSLPDFWRFASHISINSKEFGTVKLDKPYGPQRWAMTQIARGLESGIHDFVHLKCRQIGLSTIVLALDLYWPFTHGGMDGSVITHDEDTHVSFRTQLGEYYNSLPRALKPRALSHNRTEFVFRFANGKMSRLQYQIAGTRAQVKNSKLGRAKGNSFVHATEMAFWGDQSGLYSLRNALAEQNPSRLYIWESTANGFNNFEEMWRGARKATTQRAIFISWWAHELYRLDRNDQRFKVYWGENGKMTKEERQLARDVALLYPDAMEYVNGTKQISPEQVAWYRWYSEEKVADPDMVMQEMPWTEHHAFVVTGAQYFRTRDLTESQKRINTEPPPTYLRIEIRHTMSDCRILAVPKKVATLFVYEAPKEGAHYVLGADPAYGSSDWADAFCISVWRAYSDRLVQVAEYRDPDILPYAFAWVMCYLAGCYAPCAWNLEVNGPGLAVLGEIDHLKTLQWTGSDADKRTMRNFLGGMKEFLYTKTDQISRLPSARGTMSTVKEKTRYMTTLKDYYARDMVEPHSRELLEEMKWVTQEPGCAPGASGRRKDDRVVAAALACQHWHDKLRKNLLMLGVTHERTAAEPMRQMTVYEALIERQKRLMGVRLTGRQLVPGRRLQ